MEEASALATFLSDMTTFFTSLIEWFSSLVEFFIGQPVLFVFVLITLAGTVISMIRRWLPGRG